MPLPEGQPQQVKLILRAKAEAEAEAKAEAVAKAATVKRRKKKPTKLTNREAGKTGQQQKWQSVEKGKRC